MQRLKEFNDRSSDRLPTMYKKGYVNWFLDIDKDGNMVGNGFVAATGSTKNGLERVIPAVTKTSGIKPCLLVDTAEYVLGVQRDEKSPRRHQSFVEQVIDCAEQTGSQLVKAVEGFLIHMGELAIPPEMSYRDVVAIRVDGMLPSDEESVMVYWARVNSDDADTPSGVCCHICGKPCVPVSPHPLNIKGLGPIGGQTTGMAMVSANSDAFESYGLEKSKIAPTCQACAIAYANGANELLRRDDTHLFVGPSVYVFWTRSGTTFNAIQLFSSQQPDPEQVKALILSVYRGRQHDAMDDEVFYATIWSASGARIAVRDWVETTVGDVRRNVGRWFSLQRISGIDGDRYFSVYQLASSLYRDSRDARDNMSPNIPRVLFDVALKGGLLPQWLLYQAVKRNRLERGVTAPRLALIKMVLASGVWKEREDDLVELDENNVNPAYLCGRLFAEIEATQEVAIGAGTTVRDKFFGSASSAPASVFGILIRGYQAHLSKLRKEKPGFAVVIEKRVESICKNLSSFPRVLTLEEQALFALGYYHQKVRDRTPKETGDQGVAMLEPESNDLMIIDKEG